MIEEGITNKGKKWVYHATKPPMVVTDEEAEELYEDGWSDTPATFKGGAQEEKKVPRRPIKKKK